MVERPPPPRREAPPLRQGRAAARTQDGTRHLRRTDAMVRSASNEIARARLALERTSVKAPFNAMVVQESVELGQLVEAGSDIGILVGTDEFWVQAALPVTDLARVPLPGPDRVGADAQVYLDGGNGRTTHWNGQVVRLLSDLEPTGRMARLLIRVQDPLGLNNEESRLPLLLGSYVRVEIDAGKLEDVLVIPREALREGDRIWVVDQNNEIQIREAEPLWTRQETFIIPNVIATHEQLVVGGLKTALPGLKVDPQPANTTDPEPSASDEDESAGDPSVSLLTSP